jgi:hypothetical protein
MCVPWAIRLLFYRKDWLPLSWQHYVSNWRLKMRIADKFKLSSIYKEKAVSVVPIIDSAMRSTSVPL